MSPRHRALAIAGLSLLLACVAALPQPSVFEGADWLRLHLLNKAYAVEALRDGRLPLWNPWVALGRPFLADTETAVLYPPNLLYLALPIPVALFTLIVGHYALAVVGMLWLGRLLAFPPWLAWLQAAAFLLAAPLVLHLTNGQPPYMQAMCYVPLAVASAMRLQDAPSGRHVAILAAVLGLQLLCGHPQMPWLTWLFLAAYVAGRATTGSESRSWSFVAGWGGLAASLALGLAASAAMLLPFAELVAAGNRSAPSLEFAGGGTMEWRYWLSLFVPDAGRQLFPPGGDLYSGLLASLGIAGLLQLADRNARGLLAAAVTSFLLASGPRTPVFSLLFHAVPGVAQLHVHGRAAFLLSLSVTLGAGLILRQPVRGPGRFARLAFAASLAGSCVLLAQRLWPSPAPWLGDSAVRLALLALAFVLAIASAAPGNAAPALAARIAFGALVLGELALALLPARAAWALPSPSAGERPLFRALQQAGLYQPSGEPPRVLVPPWIARDNAGLIYKWSNVTGYNALTLDRVWRYQHARLGVAPPVHENTYPSGLIYERGPFPFDSMSLVAGWDSASRRLVFRRHADPRAYLVATVRRVEGWREAVRLLAAGHDPRREALVEPPLSGLGTSDPALEEQRGDEARITSFAPERVVVTTAAEGPRLLVLAEAYYPGWQATVDGRSVACVPANAWMRAAVVPGGRHTVVFSYRSRWLPLGALVSALAVGVLVLIGRRR